MKKVKKWIRKNKFKIAVSIIIAILLVVISILVVSMVHNIKYKYEVERIIDYKYFSFYQDGKVGIIDTKGDIIISPNYYNIQIPNPTKPVFVCIYDYNLEDGSYSTKVCGEKEEEIITGFDKVEAISISGTVNNNPFEKEVLKYKKDGKFGLISLDGKVITKPIYDEIQSLKYKEGQILVKQDEKFGVINKKGQNLIPIKYDDITGDGFYIEEKGYALSGYIVCIKMQDGYRYGYINYTGKVLLDTKYSEIYRINQLENKKDVYLVARKDGKYGVTKNKKTTIDFENQNIEYNSKEQLLIIEKNNKFGVYNLDGKQILEKRYSEINFEGIYIHAKINEDDLYFDTKGNQVDNIKYALVNDTKNDNYLITINNDGLYGVINKNNEVLIDNAYKFLEYAYDDYFIAYNRENKLGVIDIKGNIVVKFQYDVLSKISNFNILEGKMINKGITDLYSKQMSKIDSFEDLVTTENEDYIELYNGKFSRYLDKDGNTIDNKKITTDSKLYVIEQNGKYGFCDIEGNIKVECIYEGVTEFNKYGFAGIKQNGKWGSINGNGEILQRPIYELNDTGTIPDFIGKYYKVEYEYGKIYYTDTVIE